MPARADAVVLGAGVAGLSAAAHLADAGRRVVVLEEAPRLGGRASSFLDRSSGERVDNGQHALFGCYRETYAFLRRIGAADRAPLQPSLSLTMADEDGRRDTLVCPRLPAPWHLVAGLLRWRAVGLADRASAVRLTGLLRAVARRGAAAVADAVPADMTVAAWLASCGQARALCDWLWTPLALAALNQTPDVAAARPFVRVLGELFAPDPSASSIGLASVPLDELFAGPAAAFIEARGGVVMTRARGRIRLDASGARVEGAGCGSQVIRAPVVISAVPWHAFARAWDSGVPAALAETASAAAAMRNSPIVTVNLWLDPATPAGMPAPFVGLVGGPMHWVFDRGAIVGRRASHLSAVSSGDAALGRQRNDAIADAAWAQIRRAIPELARGRLRRAVVVREMRATFSLAPDAPPRPGPHTPIAGLFLAGDWTDTGLPATIEGAVFSGHRVARIVLDAGS